MELELQIKFLGETLRGSKEILGTLTVFPVGTATASQQPAETDH